MTDRGFWRFVRGHFCQKVAEEELKRCINNYGNGWNTGWTILQHAANGRMLMFGDPIIDCSHAQCGERVCLVYLEQLIVNFGADVNAMNGFKNCALHYAVGGANTLEVVRILIRHGARVKTPGAGDNVLDIACKRSNVEMAEMLIECGANIWHLPGFDRLVETARQCPDTAALIATARTREKHAHKACVALLGILKKPQWRKRCLRELANMIVRFVWRERRKEIWDIKLAETLSRKK